LECSGGSFERFWGGAKRSLIIIACCKEDLDVIQHIRRQRRLLGFEARILRGASNYEFPNICIARALSMPLRLRSITSILIGFCWVSPKILISTRVLRARSRGRSKPYHVLKGNIIFGVRGADC
jgi:hypothetical protein